MSDFQIPSSEKATKEETGLERVRGLDGQRPGGGQREVVGVGKR